MASFSLANNFQDVTLMRQIEDAIHQRRRVVDGISVFAVGGVSVAGQNCQSATLWRSRQDEIENIVTAGVAADNRFLRTSGIKPNLENTTPAALPTFDNVGQLWSLVSGNPAGPRRTTSTGLNTFGLLQSSDRVTLDIIEDMQTALGFFKFNSKNVVNTSFQIPNGVFQRTPVQTSLTVGLVDREVIKGATGQQNQLSRLMWGRTYNSGSAENTFANCQSRHDVAVGGINDFLAMGSVDTNPMIVQSLPQLSPNLGFFHHDRVAMKVTEQHATGPGLAVNRWNTTNQRCYISITENGRCQVTGITTAGGLQHSADVYLIITDQPWLPDVIDNPHPNAGQFPPKTGSVQFDGSGAGGRYEPVLFNPWDFPAITATGRLAKIFSDTIPVGGQLTRTVTFAPPRQSEPTTIIFRDVSNGLTENIDVLDWQGYQLIPPAKWIFDWNFNFV